MPRQSTAKSWSHDATCISIGAIEEEESVLVAQEMTFDALQVVGIGMADGKGEHAVLDGPGGAVEIGEDLVVPFQARGSIFEEGAPVDQSVMHVLPFVAEVVWLRSVSLFHEEDAMRIRPDRDGRPHPCAGDGEAGVVGEENDSAGI